MSGVLVLFFFFPNKYLLKSLLCGCFPRVWAFSCVAGPRWCIYSLWITRGKGAEKVIIASVGCKMQTLFSEDFLFQVFSWRAPNRGKIILSKPEETSHDTKSILNLHLESSDKLEFSILWFLLSCEVPNPVGTFSSMKLRVILHLHE